MKKVLGTGYIYANVIQDEWEGNPYYRLEILIDEKRNIFEKTKLESAASYCAVLDMFEKQAKANKQ